MTKMDYINKNVELKNIYRSFNALHIFLARDNLEIIMSRFDSALDRIVLTLKDAFEVKNNACIEHAITLIQALIINKPKESVDMILVKRKLPLMMLGMIENKAIQNFLHQLLFCPE